MKHTEDCNGYHTSCEKCGDDELKICCNEFGAPQYCNKHEIEDNEVYQQIIKDSYGGIMYDVANRSKYDSAEIISLWNNMPSVDKEAAGGIMCGVFSFLKGE